MFSSKGVGQKFGFLVNGILCSVSVVLVLVLNLDSCLAFLVLIFSKKLCNCNEKLTDLLNSPAELKIMDSTDGTINVNCVDKIVKSYDGAMDLLQKGENERHYGETAMNERSSRSHVLFRIVIECYEANEVERCHPIWLSQLNLVDLAGSENAKNSGTSAERLAEGSNINRRLLTLSKVVNLLSRYGTYKLGLHSLRIEIRLLQNALGSNSLSAMICCVTPTRESGGQTHSTLRFATSAKKVTNKPIVNLTNASTDPVVSDLQRQLREMNISLQSLQDALQESDEAKLLLQQKLDEALAKIEQMEQCEGLASSAGGTLNGSAGEVGDMTEVDKMPLDHSSPTVTIIPATTVSEEQRHYEQIRSEMEEQRHQLQKL